MGCSSSREADARHGGVVDDAPAERVASSPCLDPRPTGTFILASKRRGRTKHVDSSVRSTRSCDYANDGERTRGGRPRKSSGQSRDLSGQRRVLSGQLQARGGGSGSSFRGGETPHADGGAKRPYPPMECGVPLLWFVEFFVAATAAAPLFSARRRSSRWPDDVRSVVSRAGESLGMTTAQMIRKLVDPLVLRHGGCLASMPWVPTARPTVYVVSDPSRPLAEAVLSLWDRFGGLPRHELERVVVYHDLITYLPGGGVDDDEGSVSNAIRSLDLVQDAGHALVVLGADGHLPKPRSLILHAANSPLPMGLEFVSTTISPDGMSRALATLQSMDRSSVTRAQPCGAPRKTTTTTAAVSVSSSAAGRGDCSDCEHSSAASLTELLVASVKKLKPRESHGSLYRSMLAALACSARGSPAGQTSAAAADGPTQAAPPAAGDDTGSGNYLAKNQLPTCRLCGDGQCLAGVGLVDTILSHLGVGGPPPGCPQGGCHPWGPISRTIVQMNLDHHSGQPGLSEDTISRMFHHLGTAMVVEGNFDLAEDMYWNALRAFSDDTAEGSHQSRQYTAGVISNLGSLMEAKGEIKTAELLHHHALRLRIHALGEQHPDVMASMKNLAALYDETGDYRAAQAIYNRILGARS